MTFKPLLAATLTEADFAKIKFPVSVSAKLDGIRALVMNQQFVSRNLKPIRNKFIQSILKDKKTNGLDGELIVGDPRDKMVLRKTNSGVMSEDGEPDFTFWVFDDYTRSAPFLIGFQNLEKMDFDNVRIKVLPHQIVHSVEEMLAFEDQCLQEGFEGIMIRSLDGVYKQGRSTMKEQILMKLKRFSDCESFVVGYKERMHNANEATTDLLGRTERSMHQENMVGRGDVGALWLALPKKGFSLDQIRADLGAVIIDIEKITETELILKKFNEGHPRLVVISAGSGLTDEERKTIWENKLLYLKRLVTIKYFAYGDYDVPRFPTILGMREIGT